MTNLEIDGVRYRVVVEEVLHAWLNDYEVELTVDQKHALLYGVVPKIVEPYNAYKEKSDE